MNPNVLASSYAISGAASSELNAKMVSVSSPVAHNKMAVIRCQQQPAVPKESGRRAAMVLLAATLFSTAAASNANAGVIEDYLEKSKANKV